VLEIELNTLTGEYQLRDVEAIHDVGDAIIPSIDRGQVEGAFAQGYGWYARWCGRSASQIMASLLPDRRQQKN
jgi:xanthine dehydrogenase molybdopterin-binding subunit B